MKKARIIVLTIALIAGGIAAYLASSGETARSALIRLATFAALAYLSRMPKILFEPCIPTRGTAGTVRRRSTAVYYTIRLQEVAR